MGLKHFLADGTDKEEIIDEKTVCNKSVTNQIFGGIAAPKKITIGEI
ncbi:MAG: hypothetical protein K2P34_04030 [Lachnospiraceae bacterium]|nr:hypothetical protein [Lachnospiraceae bacterium]